ncbi:hypothetical protein HJC23_000347 [Cyclotella cryptica]|uniref:Ion transport domain-containing protein n=1 Tax=Cyclotella cryptica TaxID=29204 RepID=A0ABD3PNN3_9STRA
MPRKTSIEFSSSSNNCSDISSYRDDEYYDYDDYDDEELDPLTTPLDELIDLVNDYDAPRWDGTTSAPSFAAAIETKGEFDTTSLHVACRNNPPTDVVDVMIMAAPDMIYWADSFGWLPLHYACANGADLEVVRLLVDAYPDSRLVTDKRGRTPLHFALGNVETPATVQLVRLLAGKRKESVRWPDENQMLPLHYACAYGAPVEVCVVLIECWEEGMGKKDAKGRNALHFAMGNADRTNTPAIVQTLLSLDDKGQLDTLDSDSCLPLHLLNAKAEYIEETNELARENILNCVKIYLGTKPKMRNELFVGILNMPEWVKDAAVIHPTVQTMLNTKISSRFPTMILMLDCYFLAAVIAAFSVTSLQSIERRNNPNNTSHTDRDVSAALLSPLYIGAFYFLLREITQMISVREHTSLMAYLRDLENFFNLTFVFLISYYSVLMQTGLGDDERFRIGCAFTMGVCWNQVLSYFRSILIDFAVFVSGVLFVVKRLVAFMICMIIMVVAFAQMYYTLFRHSEECERMEEDALILANTTNSENATNSLNSTDDILKYFDDEYASFFIPESDVEDCEPELDYPYCTSIWASIYKTYNLMLGEQDDDIFVWSTTTLVLNCVFFFLVVILLLNVLIAIICDLYGIITNDRAAIVFWGNRLAFIVDMDMITDGPWKETVRSIFRLRDDVDEEGNKDDRAGEEEKVEISWERILWKKLVENFDPRIEEKRIKTFLLLPWRVCVSMFFIPFWLLVGILSAGWLWPPQVREGLFVQRVSMPKDSTVAQEAELRMHEVGELRHALSTVQNEIVDEFNKDRTEMLVLKVKMDKMRKELKDEMKNIKKTMTSLFQIQQQMLNM